jgi:hypothetical protein
MASRQIRGLILRLAKFNTTAGYLTDSSIGVGVWLIVASRTITAMIAERKLKTTSE